MNRVELKERGFATIFKSYDDMFLMNRVELKGAYMLISTRQGVSFLMNRVELKGNTLFNILS